MTEIHQRVSNGFLECDQKLIKPEEVHMEFAQKSKLNPISSLVMCTNCSINQGLRNGRNSVEYDQKLIRPGADQNVFGRWTWAKSHK